MITMSNLYLEDSQMFDCMVLCATHCWEFLFTRVFINSVIAYEMFRFEILI